MSSPSAVIVVLTWNGRDLTLDCLASLRHLDYPTYRVLVVDNGSTDGTVAAIRRLYPEVGVLENGENLGFAEGNNAGIRHALAGDADYVMLLNNDTTVDRDMLTVLIGVAEADPSIGVVGPAIYYHDHPDTIWSAGNAIDWRGGALQRVHADERDIQIEAPYESDYVTGCALCMKREVMERIDLIDGRYFIYFEETDWCLRARAQGYRVVVVPRARMWHKVSASMKRDSPATTYYMTRNRFLFVGNHLQGRRRSRALATTWLREMRTVAAHTVRPRYRALRRNRDARVMALRDALLGRWGKMGADVARVCYPST